MSTILTSWGSLYTCQRNKFYHFFIIYRFSVLFPLRWQYSTLGRQHNKTISKVLNTKCTYLKWSKNIINFVTSVRFWQLSIIFEFILQTLLCFSTPNTHPFISDAEKKFLNQNVESLNSTNKRKLDPVPWKALLRSVPLWALTIAGVSFYLCSVYCLII